MDQETIPLPYDRRPTPNILTRHAPPSDDVTIRLLVLWECHGLGIDNREPTLLTATYRRLHELKAAATWLGCSVLDVLTLSPADVAWARLMPQIEAAITAENTRKIHKEDTH